MTREPIRIGSRLVGPGHPTYIIAEIGSNFDGSLERARALIDAAAEVGCDAAKFQTFLPERIISAPAFGIATGFQARWDRPVDEVYRDAALPREWHAELALHARKSGVDFFSSPYDREGVDLLEGLEVPAHKIGSGDITWLDFCEYVASKGRPVILGTGASTLAEVDQAVRAMRATGNDQMIVLQCVTDYPSEFGDANIRAMVTMGEALGTLVGYSDHTPGHTVPLGAVAHGACVIEKHFTDDTGRSGPDHPFAMDIPAMASMVREIRNLEAALGDGVKRLMPSERETVVLQRRGLTAARDLSAGHVLEAGDISVLRPARGLAPSDLRLVLGWSLGRDIAAGQPIEADSLSRPPG
jgi:sialic acid synthase SpsE